MNRFLVFVSILFFCDYAIAGKNYSEQKGLINSKKIITGQNCSSLVQTIGGLNSVSLLWLDNNENREAHYALLNSQKKSDEKILSDACEAIIGAVFVDKGYNYVKEFVLRLWKHEIDKSHITILDPKTKLQEHSLKMHKKLPVYRFISSKGPRHNPIFKISVIIDGSKQFIGLGNSKKQAQQDGAHNLLKSININ